jgi:hypothetical protein
MTATHFIRAHFGPSDPIAPQPALATEHVTRVNLVSGHSSLGFGIGTAIVDAAKLGLAPTEIGLDLLILAALVYAADTRIRRPTFSQDSWTREIRLEIPVSDPAVWTANAPLVNRMLRFL